jgi:lipooligosaccharide transport system ATP-binding protein
MSATPALEAIGLRKSFAGKTVVDGVDLSCGAGTVVGLLGPNGAGKTTTLRMLYGFLTPDAGTIRFSGSDFRADRTRLKRHIGVCTQDDTLDEEFTVEQNLRRFAGYFRPRVDNLESRIALLMEQFGLNEYADHKPPTLSGGFRRRLMIARAVVHSPRVLFLDEPTTGLDPQARMQVWKMVDQLRDEAMGIILTTHYMNEAERLSDRLVVLHRGKRLAEGTPKDVIGQQLGEHVVVFETDHLTAPISAWMVERKIPQPPPILGECHVAMRAPQLAEFTAAFPGARFSVREPALDDLFLRLAVER